MAYAGTSEVERLLRVYQSKILVGTAATDNIGTSDIRIAIDDADDFIDGLLSDIKDTLPLTTVPGSIRFASKYLSAYFIHTSIFAASKPGKQSPVVESWNDLAMKAVQNYKNNITTSGKPAKWTSTDRAFTERGVEGVSYGDMNGIVKDEDISDNQ